MKCNGELILYQNRLTEAYHEVGASFLSFLDMSTGCIVYDTHGHAKKRLQRLFNTAKDDLYDLMERMSGINDTVEDNAENALYKMVRELRYCGFDFWAESEKHAYKDPFEKTWHSQKIIQQHTSRAAFVQAMAMPTQTYYASILMYVRDYCGFGAKRLSELYALFMEDYNRFIAQYLRCTQSGNEEMLRMIAVRQERIVKLGLELIDIDVKNGGKPKPETSGVNNMSEYSWDKLKGGLINGRLQRTV